MAGTDPQSEDPKQRAAADLESMQGGGSPTPAAPDRSPELQAAVEKELFDAQPADNPYLPDVPQGQPRPPNMAPAPGPASLPKATNFDPLGGLRPTSVDTAPNPPLDLSDAIPSVEQMPNREQGRTTGTPLGQKPPPDPQQSHGTEQGTNAPGFQSIQSAQDVNGAMVNYQSQLTQTLTVMAKVLLDATARLEAIEAYFDRLR